jgi:hypothetical protein
MLNIPIMGLAHRIVTLFYTMHSVIFQLYAQPIKILKHGHHLIITMLMRQSRGIRMVFELKIENTLTHLAHWLQPLWRRVDIQVQTPVMLLHHQIIVMTLIPAQMYVIAHTGGVFFLDRLHGVRWSALLVLNRHVETIKPMKTAVMLLMILT